MPLEGSNFFCSGLNPPLSMSFWMYLKLPWWSTNVTYLVHLRYSSWPKNKQTWRSFELQDEMPLSQKVWIMASFCIHNNLFKTQALLLVGSSIQHWSYFCGMVQKWTLLNRHFLSHVFPWIQESFLPVAESIAGNWTLGTIHLKW